jgi:hypothetical protein
VGGHAVTQTAASASQMGRFETEVLTQEGNLSALTGLSGRWIERVSGISCEGSYDEDRRRP